MESSAQIVKTTYYRTARTAGDGLINVPTQLATITNSGYRNACSLVQEGNAYLQPCTIGLEYDAETGIFTINGYPASAAKLRRYGTKEVPSDLDLPFLQFCYTILLANFNAQISQSNEITMAFGVYYPAVAKAIGKPHNISRNDVESFIKKILSFNSVVGFIDGEIKPVLLYIDEDRTRNVVYFQSPYLLKVISTIYKVSIRRDRKGNPILKKDGTPQLAPAYSRLAKATLVKERNKRAVVNVLLILYTIENAGNSIPHIKASTLIERNTQLKASLEGKSTRRQNEILSSTFKKTWALLESQTDLKKVYSGIELPDPTNPDNIPTTTTLDRVFTFRHGGKSHGQDGGEETQNVGETHHECRRNPPRMSEKSTTNVGEIHHAEIRESA